MEGVGTGAGRKVGYAGRPLDPGFTALDVNVAIEAILVELSAAGISRSLLLSKGRWAGTTSPEGVGAIAVIFPMP